MHRGDVMNARASWPLGEAAATGVETL
jgi:hypothetical protein